MQIKEKDREIERSRQIEVEESDAYSLFKYVVRSQITRDYYLRWLWIFLNYISLLPEGTMEESCNLLASKGKKNPSWAEYRDYYFGIRQVSFYPFFHFKQTFNL
jgi:hypothetical protein